MVHVCMPGVRIPEHAEDRTATSIAPSINDRPEYSADVIVSRDIAIKLSTADRFLCIVPGKFKVFTVFALEDILHVLYSIFVGSIVWVYILFTC